MHLSLIGVPKIMAISRIKGTSKLLAASLLICASLVYGPSAALAQMTDSSGEQTELRPNTLRPSGQAPESQQSRTQEALPEASCSIRGFFHETWTEASQFGQGLKAVPRGTIRPGNLKWELPILAATGVLIAKVDRPADNRIQSKSLQQTAGQWSNWPRPGDRIGCSRLWRGVRQTPFLLARYWIQGTGCDGSGWHRGPGAKARV